MKCSGVSRSTSRSVDGGAEPLGREAGVVDEHVDRLAADGGDELGDRVLVAGVDGVDVRRDGVQLVGSVRRAATTDDGVPACREHLRQFESESTVGPGDHDRVHQMILSISSSCGCGSRRATR